MQETDELVLDLSEAKINEALHNITLSVMYRRNWWKVRTTITQTTRHNIFSFSSRPRLIVPCVASLISALPFLLLGFTALRVNNEPFTEPGFILTLAVTAGSQGLKNLIKSSSAELDEDVMGARIRYGYVYGDEGGRKLIALEDEVVEVATTKELRQDWMRA